jgi:hypothetical protein
MQSTQENLTTVSLPARLDTVFRSLRSGRHICRTDGADYADIERHEDEYRSILRGLGYTLVHHPQGFYYLRGTGAISAQRLRAIVLFLLILFQDLEDNKFKEDERSWERSITRREFRVSELPHFDTVQRRTLLDSVGVTPATLQSRVLRFLRQLGMIDVLGEDRFTFRPAVHRFLDLFLEYAQESGSPARKNADIANESTD